MRITSLLFVPVVIMALPGCMQLAAEISKLDEEVGTRQYLDVAAASRACPAIAADIRDSLADGRLTHLEYRSVSAAYGKAALAQERRIARDAALREASLLPKVAPPPPCRRSDPRTGRPVMPRVVDEMRTVTS